MTGERAIELATWAWYGGLAITTTVFLCWAAWSLRSIQRRERTRDAEEHAEQRRQLVDSARYPREPR